MSGPAHTLYGVTFPKRSGFSRTKFESIMSFLHISDPDSEDPADRLTKVRPMLQHLNETCQQFYQPYQNISIDERMVKSKARFPMQQYIKNKPVKRGFKLWCLCDSRNGYTWRLQVYRGKEGEQRTENGLSYDVVTSLVQGLDKQGYRLYCDNFYTSPTLFRFLKLNGIEACGTAVTNRREFPEKLKPYIKILGKASVERGEGRWFRDGELVHILWRDTKVVCISSTFHRATGSEHVERRVKDRDGGLVRRKIPVPPAILDYNQQMGGVDLSDQFIGYYQTIHKTRKYWKTLFFHMIDVMVTNAFLLYREHMPSTVKVTHKKFRELLVTELCEGNEDEQERLQSPQSQSHVRAPHQLSFLEREDRQYCDLCKLLKKPRHRTRYLCTKCQKYLCFEPDRNCFRRWHSSECDKFRK